VATHIASIYLGITSIPMHVLMLQHGGNGYP